MKCLRTPREGNRYRVIPYSHKINWALDHDTSSDLIVYLDNGSMPHPEKLERMAWELEQHPDWGAVYCGQHRTGFSEAVFEADRVMENAHGQLNFTQVMHRRTDDRWTLDMQYADPDLADAVFWTSLHDTLGPFYPVPGGVLDEHHIPDPKAQGL